MARRQIDPRKQFSKKLAGRAEWFWFLYMVLVVIALVYQPTVATAIIALAVLVTIVMVTSVLAYTDNSKYDKALYTMRELKINKIPQLSTKEKENTSENEEGDVG